MSATAVHELLAKRSAEEKQTLLREILRELVQENPRQPIAIQDESGQPMGLFAPFTMKLHDDKFVEGTPEFFAELDRRRQANNRITAEDALRQLRS